jgi:hypothetical protein
VFVYCCFGMRGVRGEGCDGWILVGKDGIGSVFLTMRLGILCVSEARGLLPIYFARLCCVLRFR